MKQLLKLSSFLTLALLISSGCAVNSGNGDSLDIQDAYVGDLFEFKDAYVGDASAVLNIVSQLKSADHFQRFELKTAEEPYGMILNYGNETTTEQETKNTAIYNATFLYTLIRNAELITFKFAEQEHTITRVDLENWYGKDLREVQSEDEVKSLLQKYVNDEEMVNQLVTE
ncbi:DUF4825 domain-containing protein [Sporosarcina sp. BI001-red]|uniref:DUF4825 domain-containing protein n=1 Tax=Sporosarcina sp. BI001-red TaxID=2282866 RepID=UPI000E235B93|nr:DUF4825 domain-containing protein [Sporosarcina sp. BI001-red]REB07490.1 DUF4825 domain-containing protein [Sporosarcina sp. BI001-red]